MKNKIKKLVCSLMPFWVESLYTSERYSLNKFKPLVKAVLMLLPSFFLYTASNYKPTDRRRIKYWLPYGVMRDRQLKTYGKRIENGYHSKSSRVIRWFLPYGYVLWWDYGSNRQVNQTLPEKTNASAGVNNDMLLEVGEKVSRLQDETAEIRRGQMELAERIEVSLLKLAIAINERKL